MDLGAKIVGFKGVKTVELNGKIVAKAVKRDHLFHLDCTIPEKDMAMPADANPYVSVLPTANSSRPEKDNVPDAQEADGKKDEAVQAVLTDSLNSGNSDI